MPWGISPSMFASRPGEFIVTTIFDSELAEPKRIKIYLVLVHCLGSSRLVCLLLELRELTPHLTKELAKLTECQLGIFFLGLGTMISGEHHVRRRRALRGLGCMFGHHLVLIEFFRKGSQIPIYRKREKSHVVHSKVDFEN